jgi:PAS domain S-box-containing protein
MGKQDRDKPPDTNGEKPFIGKEAVEILDAIADGVFTVDTHFVITYFNRAAEEITGVSRDDAVGRPCCDVFHASICESECAVRFSMKNNRPVVNKAIYIVNTRGKRIPVSISAKFLKDGQGRIIGGVETFRDLTLVEALRRELTERYSFSDILSRNHEMQKLFDLLPEVAESEATVLIEGESGTGKELFAWAIHQLSPRKKKKMVTVNCGALPDTLLDSELFGYKAGAFTDAKKDKPGRFALAEGGTLFLDEIGDISPVLQVKLLRAVQNRTYEPLGATSPVKADVRLIAATNKNLRHLVEKDLFREDLYYRVNVVNLRLPPLRERKEDIPLLTDHFISRFNHLRGRDIEGLSPDTLMILTRHDFPGNVRELENIIEHAFVMCRSGMILPVHLPDYLQPRRTAPDPGGMTSLAALEGRFLMEALRRNNWNRTATAKELGMHKTTLWRKMKKLGLSVPRDKA